MAEKVEKLVYFAAFLPEGNVPMVKYLEEDIWSAVSPETTVNLPNGLCTHVGMLSKKLKSMVPIEYRNHTLTT